MLTCTFEDGHSTTNLRHITTAVVVLDKTARKVLVIKRGPQFSEPNTWALPGGYTDRDETIAAGAIREVLEETGYQISDLKQVRIIDNPDRRHDQSKQNVEFSYIATVGDRVGEPDHESTEVTWFAIDKLPPESEWAFDHYETLLVALKQHRA